MRKFFTLLIAIFAFCNIVLSTNYNIKLHSLTASSVGAIATTSQHFIGTGSWQNDPAASAGKMELYLPLSSLDSFTIDQITSLSFTTQKVLPAGSNLDFYWTTYTAGTKYGWYQERLTSEPMYYNNYNSPYNVWTTSQTPSGNNQMTFYDSHYGPTGFYNAPTLTDLQAGPINWHSWTQGGAVTSIDYGVQTVSYISLSTGSAWNSTLLSYLDDIIITLTNGNVLTIDLEAGDPTPTTTIQTPGLTPGSLCDNYDVPVTVQDFTNIGAISLVLNFDPSVFVYQTVGVTLNSAIAAAGPNTSIPGQFTLGYYGSGVTLPDNAVLFTLHFTMLPHSSGATTNLTWSTAQGDCEYSGPNGVPTYVSNFVNEAWTIPARPVKNTNTSREYCTIQSAIDDPLTLDTHTITVDAGNYPESLNITKSISLIGAGKDLTIVQPTVLLSTGIAHKYDPNMQVAVLVNGKSSVTIKNMTIDGNNLGANAVVFWNSSSGVLENMKILNPAPFTGMQTGQGLAVDASAPGSATLNINQCEFLQWNKNAVDAVNGNGASTGGGNLSVNVNGGSITGRGPQALNAQNGILLWARGGGNVACTINGTSISGVQYTPTGESCAILLLSAQPSSVSNCIFTSVDQYITNYYPGAGYYSGAVDATTGNIFDGISPASSLTTVNQLGAIEDKIGHKMDDFNGNLVTFLTNNVISTVYNLGIQKAINAASEGWTVDVASGNYTENVNLTKNLTILGQPPTGGASRPVITGLITKDASLSAFNGMFLKNLVFSNTSAILDFAAGTNISGNGLVFQGTDFNFNGTTTPTGPSGYNAPLTFVSLNISGTTGLKFINSSLSIQGTPALNGLFSLIWMQATGGPILFDGITVSGNYTDGGTLMGAQFNLGTAPANVELKNSSTSLGGNFYLSGITGLSVHNNTFSNAGLGINNVQIADVTNNLFQNIDQTYKCGGGGTPSVLTNRVIQMEAAWGDASSRLKDISVHNNIFSNINNVHSVWVTRYTAADPTATTFLNVHVNQNDFSGAHGIVAASDYASAVLDATCNWWGTTSTLAIAAKVNGNVNFIPFLMSAPPDGDCTGSPSPTTTIQTPTSISCNSYDVDVKVTDFTEIGAISLVLNYDPSVFAYQSVTLNPAISSALNDGSTPGQFTLGEYPVPAVTLSDNSVLFTLHFTLLPHSSGATTNITWSTVPDQCQYAGPYGTPVYSSTFVDLTPAWTIPLRPVKNTNTLREYCTIQSAIDDPATFIGHTITVAPGIYNENQVLIYKAISVLGAGYATTIIDGGSTSLTTTGLVRITAGGNVTFDGFTLQNAGGPSYPGDGGDNLLNVGIYAQAGITGAIYTISNNKIIGTNNANDEQDYGLYSNGGKESLVFSNNTIIQTGANEILLEKHEGASNISDNILDAGAYGIDPIFYMTYGGLDVTTLQKVHHNTIDLSTGSGTGNATGVSFASSFMNPPGTYLGSGKFTNIQITDNTITGLIANRRGISLWNGEAGEGSAGTISDPVITGNTITGTGASTSNCRAIQLINLVSNATIENNLISSVNQCFRGFTYAPGTGIATGTQLNNNSFTDFTELNWAGASALNATCNWYGSTVPSVVASKINGSVTYIPWLISGVDGDLVTPGFQPSVPCTSCTLALSTSSTPANCPLRNDGTASVSVSSGGIGPYTYLWSNSETSPTINGLTGGSYSVTLTDINGCSATATVIVPTDNGPVKNVTTDLTYCTIQAAIDAASANDIISVYPGNYSETASNRTPVSIPGSYTFGLYISPEKNGITIQGVDASGIPVPNYTAVLANVELNATNNFGPDGIFMEGDNVTITGLKFWQNPALGTNKTITVIGDNFSLKYCVVTDITVTEPWGSVYIDDELYNTATNTSHIQSYTIDGNWLDNCSIDPNNGAGYSGPVSGRKIINNKIQLGDWAGASISFSGSGTGVPWFIHGVGGAIITGNTFSENAQHIRVRGDYDNSQFDWNSYWSANTFDKAVVTGINPPTDVREYSYTGGYGLISHVRRIGSVIQSDIQDVAQIGDVVKVAVGTYTEQLHITKNLTVFGSGPSTLVKSPATLPLFFTTSDPNHPVIFIDGAANCIIKNLKVDGDNQGNANYRFSGIAYWNSGGSVQNVDVVNIMDAPFSGNQHGVGIYAFNNTSSASYNISLNTVNVTDFQKTALALCGNGNLTVDINNVTTTGHGPTSVTAQNGIETWGASGTIENCTISQIAYTGGTWSASGLLVMGPGSVIANHVDIDNCQTSVYWFDADGTYKNSTITNPLGDGIYGYSDAGASNFSVEYVSATGSNFAGSWGINPLANGGVINMNITNCDIRNWNYGIYAYDYGTTGGVINTVASNNDLSTNTIGFATNAATTQMATCNWFGSTTPSVIATKITGPVTYTPWLTSGTDIDPSTPPGFTPSVSCDYPCLITLDKTHVDVSCPQTPDGSIDLIVTSGVAPFSYLWTGPDNFSSILEDISNLAVGAYTVTVTSANGCTATTSVTIGYMDKPAPAEVGGPVSTSSSVECLTAAANAPTALPLVQDACGTTLNPTGPVIQTNYDGCQGTKTYTYTYIDYQSKTFTWVYTYNIHHVTYPVVPDDGGSTVECLASATPPVPPTVVDVCSTNVPAVLVSTVDAPAQLTCQGTRTYTYTYTDCAGLVSTWHYIYTIQHSTPPVVPPAGASTVACIEDAIPPMSIQTCNPAYEATPWPDYDCMFKTYINSIVDQQQPVFNSYIMNMNTGVGQSFTPAVSGPLTQIDVNVYNFSGSPTFSVEVFPGNGKSGTPLYSASGYGISSTGWISLSIPIPTEPTLTAGSQYTFWLTPYPYNSVQLGLGYPNPYAPGESWDECILPVVKDVCGTVIPTPTPVIGGSYNGCSGTRTYTYTYTDCAGLSSDWVYTYTILPPVVNMPGPGGSTVECAANATMPVPPVIKDNCGRQLDVSTGVPGSDPGCNGTKTWAFTFTDCAGVQYPWVYTYTIQHSTPPAEVGDPVSTSSTVQCWSNAVPPTTLPVMKDVCGTVIPAPAPVITGTATSNQNCTGTVIYTYKYTDCANLSTDWVYTYTLQHTTPPAEVPPAKPIAGTVQCWSDAIPPSLPVFHDVCGNVVNPTSGSPVISGSAINNTNCDGTVVYTYTYTDCANLSTDWVFTYTLHHTTPPAESGTPVSISSTVQCWSDAVPPTTLPVMKDVCGNVIAAPTPVKSGTATSNADCTGTVIYTYTYIDCDNLSTNWVYTYTLQHTSHPVVPQNGSAPVECASLAVAPGPPSGVTDVCGNILVGQLTHTTPDPACNGTKTYTYTFTDCAGLSTTWDFVYTINDVTPPVISSCPGNITVNMNNGCTATGVNLGIPTATDNCNGTLTITNDHIGDFVEGTTTVTWTVADCAGNHTTCTQNVTVIRNALNGHLFYYNTPPTSLSNVSITLTETSPSYSQSTITQSDGSFAFTGLCAGTYTIEASTTRSAGGVNATDAAQVNAWGVTPSNIEKVKFYSGDVTVPWGQLNSGDAVTILMHFINHSNSWTGRDNWTFWPAYDWIHNNLEPQYVTKHDILVSGASVTEDLYGLCTGDFNGSFIPGSKKSVNNALTLTYGSVMGVNNNEPFDLPIYSESIMAVGAVSLIMDFPSDKLEILGVSLADQANSPVMYNVSSNELTIGWFSGSNLSLNPSDKLLTLKMKVKGTLGNDEILRFALADDLLNELATSVGEVIPNAVLNMDMIGLNSVGVHPSASSDDLRFTNYPNPFTQTTTLAYTLPVSGDVTIELRDMLGVQVKVVAENLSQTSGDHKLILNLSDLPAGIFITTLKLNTLNGYQMKRTIKVVKTY